MSKKKLMLLGGSHYLMLAIEAVWGHSRIRFVGHPMFGSLKKNEICAKPV